MKIEVMQDRIAVRRIDDPTVGDSPVFVPDLKSLKFGWGEVTAVGPGKMLDGGAVKVPQVKVGDRVLFILNAGTRVDLGKEKLLVIFEEHIIARLVPEKLRVM